MKKHLLFLNLIALLLVGCNSNVNSSNSKTTNTQTTSSSADKSCIFCNNEYTPNPVSYSSLGEYTPTTFDKATYKVDSTTKVGDGLTHNMVSYKLNSNKIVKASMLDIDLSKVTMKVGTYNDANGFNGKDTIYGHAMAYEKKNTTTKVLAGVNADFFGSRPVNACVKDGVIIQEAHIDNGGYDYTNVNHDIPASMPMLFGVGGNVGQIAPIIKSNSVQETVQSKFVYNIIKEDNGQGELLFDKDIVVNSFTQEESRIDIIYKTGRSLTAKKGSTLIELKKHNDNKYLIHGQVTKITKLETSSQVNASTDIFYIVVPSTYDTNKIKVNDNISYYINTKDDTWKYYTNVIGARHSLLENGKMPSTLSLEWSNGAKSTGVPRTAVGIKPDGTVVLVTIEGLRYGKKSTSEEDGYGVNLKELADFMRYYGIHTAANFDGGGSTQMIVRDGFNGSGDFKVTTRSSDTGSYEVTKSRKVMNSVLICTK